MAVGTNTTNVCSRRFTEAQELIGSRRPRGSTPARRRKDEVFG